MYMIVNIDLKYGEHDNFFKTMEKFKGMMEASEGGPRLLCAFISTFGHMFQIVHIWETPTADAFLGAIDGAMKHVAFPGVLEALKSAAIKEVLMFAEQTPYSPGLIGR